MPTLDTRISPWIPVREKDGSIREVGLREVLLRAHELLEIRDPLPIVEFGLYRLLVALLMDIYRFQVLRDLEYLLEDGHFSAERIDAYFATNAGDFDLFDKERPFLQFAQMSDQADKPLSGMLPVIPSGTNANHFHHEGEADFGVCPEAAARLLTTIAPFMTAGGAGLAPSINGAPPWYILVTGTSLFQTLCLNCCVVPLLPQGNDGVPAWRRSGSFEIERRQSASLLEGLTWQPRRILLVPNGPGCCSLTGRQSDHIVRYMKFAPGAAAGFAWTDPNVAYRLDAKGPLVLRPQEGKQVWRDVGPLALLQDTAAGKGDERFMYTRPRVVDQYADLRVDSPSLVPDCLKLTLYGMRTDLKMKVYEWQRESLDALPAKLVLQQFFGRKAQEEINRASKIDAGLRSALKLAYPRDGKGNSKAFDSRIDYARRRFWNSLHPEYMNLLHLLAQANPAYIDEEAKPFIAHWHDQLKRVGRETLDEAIQDLDSEAISILRTEVLVRKEFEKALFFALGGADAKKSKDSMKKTKTKKGEQPS